MLSSASLIPVQPGEILRGIRSGRPPSNRQRQDRSCKHANHQIMRGLIVAIVILGALTLGNSLLRDKRADGRVEIDLSVWGMPFENALYVKEYIPEFERQNPGIKVKFRHLENYSRRIVMLRAGGIAPDVMREGVNYGPQYNRRGFNLRLDRLIDGP